MARTVPIDDVAAVTVRPAGTTATSLVEILPAEATGRF